MATAHPRPTFDVPATMLAVELRGAGFGSLAVVERPVPVPGPHQVLCRVEAVSICAADAQLLEQGPGHPALFGWDIARWPAVPGHEASLLVVGVGERIGNRFRVGQRVAVAPDLPGPPRMDLDRYGVPLGRICRISVGFTVPGFLAQYALLREDVLDAPGHVIPVSVAPSSLPHFGAALAEPFSTVVAAQAAMVHIVRDAAGGERSYRAGVLPGGIAVVVGGGPMGLFHALHALLRRPRRLFISEPDPARREAAGLLKAPAELSGTELEIVDPPALPGRVKAASGGRGADDIIFAAGNAEAQESALRLAATGACVSFFAVNRDGRSPPIDAAAVRAKGISIGGSAGSHPADLRRALELQERGAVDLGLFVSAVGGLPAAPAAIRAVSERRFAGRIVLYPQVHGPEPVRVQGWGAEAEARFLAEEP